MVFVCQADMVENFQPGYLEYVSWRRENMGGLAVCWEPRRVYLLPLLGPGAAVAASASSSSSSAAAEPTLTAPAPQPPAGDTTAAAPMETDAAPAAVTARDVWE